MDQMGEWMLPGAALAFAVVIGIVLVAVDDIVLAVLGLWRKNEAAPLGGAVIKEIAVKSRARGLRRNVRKFLRHTHAATSIRVRANQQQMNK